jgi:hypothetical protein
MRQQRQIIHILFRDKFLFRERGANKIATPRDLEDMLPPKEGSLECHEGGGKGLYTEVMGEVKKMGMFVDASKGMVLRNAPCPQMRVQLLAVFSILVPCSRG